jgi:hypothetical protein
MESVPPPFDGVRRRRSSERGRGRLARREELRGGQGAPARLAPAYLPEPDWAAVFEAEQRPYREALARGEYDDARRYRTAQIAEGFGGLAHQLLRRGRR